MKFYPQFMTSIIDSACPSLLLTLRLVSRWVQLEVDARLARHILQTKERDGTAFLDLQFGTVDTPRKIMHGRHTAKVLDLDASALEDGIATYRNQPPERKRQATVFVPGEKLLVRYHMRSLTLGQRYMWKGARRSVHFVDTTSFFYGLHSREAAYVRDGEEGNETVFHVAYDLRPNSSWEFREFGVRRVHNRGLTLVFSPDPVAVIGEKACIVLLRVLERIVENYAETGDSVTLVGVEGWSALIPSPAQMRLDTRRGWEKGMPMQAKIEWWVRYRARFVPDKQWKRGKQEEPEMAVQCVSLEEWREELGSHVFELMMDPEAVYWGP